MRQNALVARIRALRIYFFRLIFSQSVSTKVITGDGIARLCDYQVYPPKLFSSQLLNREKLSNAKSIFVPGQMVDVFFSKYGNLVNASVLVFGNSDRDYFNLDFQLPTSVKMLMLQNAHVEDSRVKVLPIGLENLRYGKNGFKLFVRYSSSPSIDNKKILVGPFSPTHAERQELLSWQSCDSSKVTYIDKFTGNFKLSKIGAKHTFVACPRGNGTDTHRFWETLYRGSIPIVKDSSWSRQIRELGIPCLLVPSWDYEVVQRIVDSTHLKKFYPKDIKPLWLNYWQELIRLYSQ